MSLGKLIVNNKTYLIGDIPPSFDKHDKNKWLWYNDKGITWIHKMD